MDRFFVDKGDINLEEATCVMTGEDVKHISKVLRAKVGEKVEICDKNNNEYICEISEITKTEVFLDILEKSRVNRESNVAVRVYQGLPKATKMDYILQKLTEVGASEIILVKNKRSVVKFDDKKEDKKLERFERIIYEASKQSKRGIIPKLVGVMSFKEAVADMKRNDLNICPYENERTVSVGEALKEFGSEMRGCDFEKKESSSEKKEGDFEKKESDLETKYVSVGIFVGPEGGFDEEEVEVLSTKGAKVVSLGPRILRTETASVVTTAIVQYELGDI
ncbi:MAG: 16S rRNA (uracil(1498)-N(3))-methyltransferase [Clostridioides sp.]|jgi:16S rRNA (uracil1498-N3)-methyltransferase|nr:16S rRNA (uracil(1498)-N(3))-methyltransferase [Clostridioides sp.]